VTRDGIVNERFVAFADAVRRRVLAYLSTASSGRHEMAFDELVSRLVDDDELGMNAASVARLNLVHVHLPKLEQARLVDRDGDTIRLTVAPDVVADGLDLAGRLEAA
jgi:hypothetical protein